MMKPSTQKGFAGLVPVIVISVIILVGFAYFSSQKNNYPAPTTAAPSLIPTPTASPSPSPTPPPTPKPTPISTPKPTPKPTTPPYSGPPGTGLSTLTVATPKGNFTATVLALNLGNTKVVTDTASDNDCPNNCPVASLAAFVAKNGGFAGINGTYFCPTSYPECAGKTNSFDFPVYNTRLNHWINGGNLSWNNRAVVYFDGGGAHYLQNAKDYGGSPSAGIVNFPGLVDGGNVQIDENQSGLSDKQKARGTKVGIGIRDSQNVMVIIGRNMTMLEFAHVFKSLGATGALNLDDGGSVALISSGRYIFGPGRDIPNAVIFAPR